MDRKLKEEYMKKGAIVGIKSLIVEMENNGKNTITIMELKELVE